MKLTRNIIFFALIFVMLFVLMSCSLFGNNNASTNSLPEINDFIPSDPGLYEDGVLVMTWNELLEEEVFGGPFYWIDVLSIDAGVLITETVFNQNYEYYKTSGADTILNGHLYLPLDGAITAIGDDTFLHCYGLTGINIPSTVTSIGDRAFAGCYNLSAIYYNGTIEQWNAIVKGTSWNEKAGNKAMCYTIYCIDGTIATDGTVTLK
ncbi:MAG: leucine-rich repeat protein [Lachnospiraceae bacterium]|nr:leucine-rich repeat protein [Lachnospiraceae bacterium]